MMAVDRPPLSTSVRRTFSETNRKSTGSRPIFYALFYSDVPRKTAMDIATYSPVYSVYTYKCRKEGEGNKGIYRSKRSQVWTPSIGVSA